MSNSFADIFDSPDLTPAERERLRKIAAGIDRNSRLGIVAAMSSDEGLQRIASPMIQGARDDRIQYAQRFSDEQEAALARAAAIAKAQKDAEDRDFRERQQASLEDYRRQSLAAQAAARANRGGLTPYQQAKMEEAERARRAAAEAKLNAGVVKYGSEVAARAPLKSAIADVDLLLDPYRKGGGNIPGVGGLSNKEGFIGNIAAKLEGGSEIRQKIATVRNQILKARSGGAVTPQEADRLLTEFGQVATASDEDFLSAWDSFVQNNRAELAGLDAAYGADVVGEFQRREKARESAVDAARKTGRTNRGSY